MYRSDISKENKIIDIDNACMYIKIDCINLFFTIDRQAHVILFIKKNLTANYEEKYVV